MDVVDRLTVAHYSQPSSGDRPDPEQFLNEFFSKIGIARGRAACGVASSSGYPQSAVAEEVVQEVLQDLWDELRGVLLAVTSEKDQEKGGLYRRIAEIVEQVDDEEAAYVWWLHAAQAGDEVAVAIVDDLALDLSAERPSVLRSIHEIQRIAEQNCSAGTRLEHGLSDTQ
ncbi:hypothetical protein OG252_51955 [Streptomyces sp. NBC_01352]|uniref:hypothetical protein n=1 Tax=Streptomyces sp. NBC_01352 TaxID=2903834 RepID=UPI002E31EBF7|nr:hypothetical protein [Streptomyces sp. NBC_01352]